MQYLKKRFSLIELNVFIPAILFIAVIILCLTIYPQDTSQYINKIHHFLTWEMGGIFLVMTFLVVLCCLWLAFSRYGDILLGQSGEKPDFSLLTWLGLIFTSGTGGSLLYLASVEWIGSFSNRLLARQQEALRLLVGPLLMACSIGGRPHGHGI